MQKTRNVLVWTALFLSISFSGLSQSTCSGSTSTTTYTSCPGFKTFTQGGWGATANGNNSGTYLQNNFASVFPTGLTIGSTNKIKLTTANAVKAFLPQGGSASALPSGTLTNPTKSNYSNVLAGQLVALTLNVKFDEASAAFAPSSTLLKNLFIATGPFAGMTVQQLIDQANLKIGGGSAMNKTFSEYNTAIDNINRNYDNGIMSGNFLVCPLTATITPTHILCRNNATGTAVVTVNGGLAPYTYTWANSAAGNTYQANNLVAGTYTVTVTDALNQSIILSTTINQPATAVSVTATPGTILCNGGTTQVTVSANGGVGNYTGSGTQTLGAGTYTFSVTDGNGCPASTQLTIEQPTVLNISATSTPINCFGGSSTVSISANGGTPSYVGTGTQSLSAGTYNFMITDANGCSASTSLVINQPSLLTASSTASSIACFGGQSQVTVSANGGTGAYIGTGTFLELAGSHSYQVIDQNGCSAWANVEISQPTVLSGSASIASSISCYGYCNGSLSASATGGTSPYNYTWNTSETSSTISNVCAGDYTVGITDANGCSLANAITISISSPEAIHLINIDITNATCNPMTCDGSASADAAGGTSPYSFAWSNGIIGSNSTSNLCEGDTVKLIVSDAQGCTSSLLVGLISCRTPNIISDDCSQLKTFTPGGWGANPNGGNAGVYLHANFSSAFPNGITLGCGNNTLSFASAQEITDFLPVGGGAALLPTTSVLTGHLLSAMLSVGFDNYDANFGTSAASLGNLFIASGDFEGMSVNDLLEIANQEIGGCDNTYSLSSLVTALTNINQNYDNGTVNLGFLDCNSTSTRNLILSEETSLNNQDLSIDAYPNPAHSSTNLIVTANSDQMVWVNLYDLTGNIVHAFNYNVYAGENLIELDLSRFASQTYILRATTNQSTSTKLLIIQ